MSYDVSIGNWDGNYTHNSLGPLCYKHLCKDKGLKSLDGKTGSECREILASFWESVHCERLNSWARDDVGETSMREIYDNPNGWGSLIGALIFMGEVTSACAMNPRNKVRVYA